MSNCVIPIFQTTYKPVSKMRFKRILGSNMICYNDVLINYSISIPLNAISVQYITLLSSTVPFVFPPSQIKKRLKLSNFVITYLHKQGQQRKNNNLCTHKNC